MPQFLLKPEALTEKPQGEGCKGARFKLTGPDAFHIAKVLRCREGQVIELFDGRGGRFSGELSRVAPEAIEGIIITAIEGCRVARARLHLYPALLKASAWEWMIEKGTELGAVSFTPVVTPRTVVLLKRERVEAKRERWTKLILAAAKQCRRPDLPEFKPPLRFPEAIREATERGLTFLAWERMTGASSRESLKAALSAAAAEDKQSLEASLFVGPEGGFSDEEVELAEALGAVPMGLGPNTLRAETAVLAATCAILYELGGI